MEPHERLAQAMNERRLELTPRLNWRQVATAAGISYEALRAIRRGDYRPSENTAAALDDALRWERGSVEAILDGGTPTPRQVGTPEEEAAQLKREREALAAAIEQELEQQRGRPLDEKQTRVVIEWADSLKGTIDLMDEETG